MRSQKPNNQGNVHKLILENVPEIIYFVETNGDPTRGSVKFVSPSVKEIVGYTPDEFTKNPALWVSIIHPDDVGAVQRTTEEMFVMKKRIPRRYRLRHRGTDEYIWIEDKPSLIIDRNGKITGYVGVAREAAREFRESEIKFRTLADTVPYATVIYRDSKLLFANRRVEAISGYTWEEISSVGFLQLVHPDFRDFVKKRASARLRGESVPSRYELKILNRGGEERWVDITAGLIEYEGEPAGIATAFDITERKRAEQDLQKLSRAVEQTADIVFITDRNGLIEYVNPAFEKITGYRREEVVGKTPGIFKSGEHPASFYECLWKTILEGHPFRSILINKKKDGTTFFEEKTITPLRAEDGTITHFVSTGKDVTEQMKAAEVLRQSEEKQRLILSNIHEIVYSIRFEEGDVLTGTVDFVNDPVEDILGFSAEEFRINPRLWMESLHPEDLAIVQESTERLFTDKKPITRIYRIKHKHTGEYRWMEDHVVPMLATADKKVVGIFGVVRDITERKRAEEERLRLLQVLESSLNEIYMFNVESLRFTYVNDGARKNLGYSMDELQSLTPLDLKPEYTEETFRNMIRPLVLREKEVHVFETIHRRKNGTLYPVEVHLQFVETVGDRTFVAIIHDITERKRTQEELLFQSSMLDQVRNAAIATDLDGKITYWNKFAERLYGWRAEDVLGKQANDLVVPPAGRMRTSEIRNQVDETGYWEGEIEFQRKDGTIIPIHVTSALLKDSTGKATGRIGISTDITERKQAEEIARTHAERLQALSKQLLEIQENERRSLARELHDEIGQTLTSLKILLEINTKAKAGNVNESLQEALALISGLIGRVRNLSLNLRPPALDDLGLVPAIRWHLLHRTEKTGIEGHFKAEPEEIHVSGEIKTACFRVAQEALTNVLKHSKPQSVEVHVMKRGANLELTVRDDGTGFDVDSAFRRAAAGESFGLLGMQERVRLAGGTFVIRSEQGRGSEVQATFPDAFVPSL
jgi:PAS domain S-box-containing protein